MVLNCCFCPHQLVSPTRRLTMKRGIYCAWQTSLKTIRPEQVLVNPAYRLSTCAHVNENEILWQAFHNVLGAQTLAAQVNLQVSGWPNLMALSVLNKRKSQINMKILQASSHTSAQNHTLTRQKLCLAWQRKKNKMNNSMHWPWLYSCAVKECISFDFIQYAVNSTHLFWLYAVCSICFDCIQSHAVPMFCL